MYFTTLEISETKTLSINLINPHHHCLAQFMIQRDNKEFEHSGYWRIVTDSCFQVGHCGWCVFLESRELEIESLVGGKGAMVGVCCRVR